MSATNYTKAEQATVLLTCSWCGRKFHPGPGTARCADKNQCSQGCRIRETRRKFNKMGVFTSQRDSR
jgi:hypothetical protein